MAKRNPSTGKFEKRADGKIIKPPGWKAPDVEGEMGRQFKEGSWSQSGSATGSSTPVKVGRVVETASPVFDAMCSPGGATPSDVAKKLDVAIAGVADAVVEPAEKLAAATQTESKETTSKSSGISLGVAGALAAVGFALGAAWVTSGFGPSLAIDAATQTV
eukprot:COSAG02_NODE_12737_length_1501_cov_2.419401_2_plen_161_part_00